MADKTFTQEEVNTLIQERLAKEKAKYEKQIADMEADMTRRERRLGAREKLQEKGLPVELAELVKLDDEESFNTSLELLEKTYNQRGPEAEGHAAAPAYNPSGGSGRCHDRIREAMGLKQ